MLLDFFNNYFIQILQNYLNYKKSIDEQFKHWIDLGMGLTEGSVSGMTDFGSFSSFFDDAKAQNEKKGKKGGKKTKGN